MRCCSAVAVMLIVAAAGLGVAPAAAQLRPLEPLPPQTTLDRIEVRVQAGLGAFWDQRASLAGTEGTLREIGNIRGFWRTGRVVLEVGGTVLRTFEDETTFAPPADGVDPAEGPRRRDSGDYRVLTSVLVTPERWPARGYVRFGTRLPTTDNTVGLGRDRTDFFALLGGHVDSGRWTGLAEAGVGIHGTHHRRLEQSDVLIYAAGAEYRLGRVTPTLLVLGHADGILDGAIRGSEELAELRVGARIGGRFWLHAEWVQGVTEFSPRSGLLLWAGWSGTRITPREARP